MPVAGWIAETFRDIRFGCRALARERGFTAFVVATLALGIGANAAMFGILDRLLLRGPLHVRDAAELRRVISTTQPAGRPTQRTGYLGYVSYETFRADDRAFAGVAAYNLLPDGVMFGQRESARPINRGSATASFFPLLGVRPVLGRFFDEREDDPDDPQRVVVLGYHLWQSEFGGRTDILGREILLDHSRYAVVGVAPKGFTGVDLARVDVWLPESGVPHSTNWRTIWNAPWLHVIVRLRPSVSPEQAGVSLTRLHRNAYAGRDSAAANASIRAEPIHYTYAGVEATETRVSRWLLGVAAVVLLVTCTNVVNLLLARTMRRRRELAVRLALGAGRMRVVRLLVLEALMLTVAGGVAGIGIAWALSGSARALIEHVEWDSRAVDPRILWATAGFSVLASLLVGVVPAIQGSRAELIHAMKSGVREGGGRSGWLRGALTMTQAAFSVVLLVGAGLFVQSLRQVRAFDLGISRDEVLSFRVDRPGYSADAISQRREYARRDAFLPEMADRIGAWPDVARASVAAGIPFDISYSYPIRVPGRDSIPALPGGGPFVSSVTDGYFETIGTPILRGRPLGPDDRADAAPVAVVNETMARTLWPGENALGKCILVYDAEACAEIVGVAADTKRYTLHDAGAMQVYVPRAQQPTGGHPRLLVRPRGDASGLLGAVRNELLRADPSIRHVRTEILQHKVETQIRPWRLGATILTLLGVLALVVASIGLYSVISYLVSQRRQEIGVRIALGARPNDVSGMIVADGLRLAVGGIVIGLVVSLVGARGLAPLLFDTSPSDPLVFVVVPLAMTTAALLAAWVPALRARRIDPIEAMRVE